MATQEAAAQFILQPQYTNNLKTPESLKAAPYCIFVMVPAQMFWKLLVYCGCKLNWPDASWVTLCN